MQEAAKQLQYVRQAKHDKFPDRTHLVPYLRGLKLLARDKPPAAHTLL